MILYQSHPIRNTKLATNGDIFSDNYCLAMNVDKFMDLWADVHSLNINILATTLSAGVFNVTNLQEAFLAFNEIAGLAAGTSYAVGKCVRSIKPIGLMKPNGENLLESQTPNTIIDYPIFNFGVFKLNFGRAKYRDGLLYPYIELLINGDFGFNGYLIGGIDFENYGTIPIYTSLDPLTLPFAIGTISIANRYSDIKYSKSFKRGDQFRATYPTNMNLNEYKYIYFGGAKSELEVENGVLTAEIPQNAKSGQVQIENPTRYDLATLYEDVILAD